MGTKQLLEVRTKIGEICIVLTLCSYASGMVLERQLSEADGSEQTLVLPVRDVEDVMNFALFDPESDALASHYRRFIHVIERLGPLRS